MSESDADATAAEGDQGSIDTDPHDHSDSAVAAVASKAANRTWRMAKQAPLFGFLLVLFVGVQFFVTDIRHVFFSGHSYEFALVEVLYLLAILFGMSEMLRVSRPGVDNTWEAMLMGITFVVYLVLFLLGITVGSAVMNEVFCNVHFAVLTVASGAQTAVALMVNARTLKRTIDHSGGGEDS